MGQTLDTEMASTSPKKSFSPSQIMKSDSEDSSPTNKLNNKKNIKPILKAIVKDYQREKLLDSYYPHFSKFFKTFPAQKLSKFLAECQFSVLNASEATANTLTFIQSPKNSSQCLQEQDKSPMTINSPKSSTAQAFSPRNDQMMTSINLNSKLLTSSRQFSSRRETITKYFEVEIFRKGNFFFELAEVFGKAYVEMSHESLKKFEIVKRLLDDGKIPFNWIIAPKVKEQVEREFERAKIDLKRFQNLQFDLIKTFLTELSLLIGQNGSLIPSDKVIDQMNLKLLFGKSEIYDTFFTIARLVNIADEVKLKNVLTVLKNPKLEDFVFDTKLRLEQEEVPYQNVIDSLNYLDTFSSPHDKFQAIAKMRGMILKEIDRYWSQECNQGLVNKRLSLTADQLLPLYCYCLISAGNEKMRAHQIFIEEFLSDDLVQFGEQSYYFTTFKVAIDFLVNISDDPIKGLNSLNAKGKVEK